MSTQPNKLSIEELRARRQAEHEAEDCRREEEDQLFEEEVRRLAEEEETWRWEEEAEQRRKEEEERKKRLEEAKKEYARQKELEKARSEKRKAAEIEESGEEMEKEPEGSNKKVSKILTWVWVFNKRKLDKITTSAPEDYTSLWEVCAGGRALPTEGAGARLSAMQAVKSRVQLGRVEAEDFGEEGGKEKVDVGGIGGRVSSSVGVVRRSNGTGGSNGEGVEEYKWRNLGIGGGD
jgi:hypothetical protein